MAHCKPPLPSNFPSTQRTLCARRSFPASLIAAILAAAVGGVCVAASAQDSPNLVRPEFRTAPRSLITQPVDRTQTKVTLGAINTDLPLTKDLGEVEATLPMEHIQLILRRPAERQTAFDTLVEALHTPGNPSFHQWLTPEQVGENFSPSQQDIAAVTAYLQGEGFAVNRVGKSGMYIDFTGTAAQVEASFKTQVHNVLMPNGETKFAAVTDAELPVALEPAVVGFVSLSNIPPHSNRVPASKPIWEQTGGAPQSGVRPNDSQNCPGSSCRYYLGPQDFYTVYNENALLTAGTNGSGVTIAMLEETNINSADVQTFRTTFNVTATMNLTVDNGYTNGAFTCTNPNNLGSNTNEEGEAVLDTEWSGAVAPNATILFMNCATGTTNGTYLSAEAVIDFNLAPVMSMSYGAPETGNSGFSTFSTNLWEQAASQGQTVVISSGDSGAAGSADQNQSYATHGLVSNVFGNSAYNVSAGGTDFTDTFNTYANAGTSYGPTAFWNTSNGTGLISAKAGYIPEIPWNGSCASPEVAKALTYASPNLACDSGSYLTTAGGSGGYSVLNARPTWQNGTVYGLPSTATYSGRLMPDVSMFASAGPWGHAMPDYQSDTGGIGYAGGTSFVAPQLAGVFALLIQKYGQRLGQPNYVLYNMGASAYGTSSFTGGTTCSANGTTNSIADTVSLPASTCIFHDITAGTNSVPCVKTGTNCYYDGTQNGTTLLYYGILETGTTSTTPTTVTWQAGQGYDMATGLGSLNIGNLVNNWQNAAVGGSPYTPTVTVTNNGNSFTYGSPLASITYTATVSGSGSFPTGSVTFSGNNGIGSIGSADALVASSGCSSGGTCTESTTQTYSPPNTLAANTYTITGTYSTVGESYNTGSGTTSLTVSQLAPTVSSVSTVTTGTSPTTLTSQVSYTGPAAPTGVPSFQVDSGTTTAGTCTGSSSPLTCTASYVTSGLSSGTHTINASIPAAGNYSSASNTGTLKVVTQDVFVILSGGNTASFYNSGTVESSATSGGGIGAAVDASGQVWSINASGTSVAVFSNAGALIIGYSAGGINAGKALAIDGNNQTWIANGNGTVTALTNAGVGVFTTPIDPAGNSGIPGSISVDTAGSLWLSIPGSNNVIEVIGAAGPVATPTVTQVINSTPGTKP